MPGRPIAGLLLVLAAATILMGITTAEALYPEAYSTHLNEISDLGAPAATGIEAYQPSARVFNGAMLLAGSSIMLAALVLARNRWPGSQGLLLILLLVLHGAGTVGVGLFPSDHPDAHRGFAALTFVSGGLVPLMIAGVLAPSWASVVYGEFSAVILMALGVLVVGPGTLVYDPLGPGGTERWIVYPTVLWLATFGGYLMASQARPIENRGPQD